MASGIDLGPLLWQDVAQGRQPQGAFELDRDNPIAAGLGVLVVGNDPTNLAAALPLAVAGNVSKGIGPLGRVLQTPGGTGSDYVDTNVVTTDGVTVLFYGARMLSATAPSGPGTVVTAIHTNTNSDAATWQLDLGNGYGGSPQNAYWYQNSGGSPSNQEAWVNGVQQGSVNPMGVTLINGVDYLIIASGRGMPSTRPVRMLGGVVGYGGAVRQAIGAVWTRKLSTPEVESLNANPWQLVVPAGASRVRFARAAAGGPAITIAVADGADVVAVVAQLTSALTLAVVDGAETVAAAMSLGAGATVAVVDGSESVAVAAGLSSSLGLAVADGAEQVSVVAGATSASSIAVAVADGPEAVAVAGTVASSAAIAVVDGSEAVAVAGALAASLAVAVLDGADQVAVAAAVGNASALTIAVADGAEAVAAAGAVVSSAAVAVVDGSEAVAVSGALAASLAVVVADGADQVAVVASVGNASAMAIAVVDGAEAVAVAAAVASRASVAVVDGPEAVAVSGALGTSLAATVADGPDQVAVVAAVGNASSLSMAVQDGAEAVAVAGSVVSNLTGAVIDGPELVAAYVAMQASMAVIVADGAELVAAAMQVRYPGSIAFVTGNRLTYRAPARPRRWTVFRDLSMTLLVKRSAESLLYDVDLSMMLGAGEIFTDLPVVAVDETTNPPLVVGSVAVNAATIDYGDHVAPIGTVVQVQISGGSVANETGLQTYTLRVRGHTSLGTNFVEAPVALSLTDAP